MKLWSHAILFAFLSFFVHAARGQFQQDSISYQVALSNTKSVYTNQLRDQSSLFNGSFYYPNAFYIKTGTPYFLTDQFSPGSVVYDGIQFDSLLLKFEDLRQQLILNKDSYQLQLINEKVSSFIIAGHSFSRLIADSTNKDLTKTGFYEILYSGRSMVLKATDKNIQTVATVDEGMVRTILGNDNYYIKIDGRYEKIKSKSGLTAMFSPYQKEMQRFIKKNHLKYKNDRENTIIQSAGYFDQLRK